MAEVIAVASIEHLSGIPADKVTNTFAIDTQAVALGTAAPTIRGAIAAFYNTAPAFPGASIVRDYMHSIDRAAGRAALKIYDVSARLDGTPHGSPVDSSTFTVGGAAAGTPLPEEVSCVMTLRGTGWDTQLIERPDTDTPPDGRVDRPRQRYSGKLYIGPLSTAAIFAGGTSPRVADGFRDTLMGAFDDLQATLQAAGMHASVWSRQDRAFRHVDRVEVDNAFDTQRRRGPKATARGNRAV